MCAPVYSGGTGRPGGVCVRLPAQCLLLPSLPKFDVGSIACTKAKGARLYGRSSSAVTAPRSSAVSDAQCTHSRWLVRSTQFGVRVRLFPTHEDYRSCAGRRGTAPGGWNVDNGGASPGVASEPSWAYFLCAVNKQRTEKRGAGKC